MKSYDVDVIARVAHEAIRAVCFALGDHPLPPWDEAPGWQMTSSRGAVMEILGCLTHGVEYSVSKAHERWFEERLKDGWTYGLVKDVQRKENPAMMPYSQLPTKQRIKDYLMLGVVKAFYDCGKEK